MELGEPGDVCGGDGEPGDVCGGHGVPGLCKVGFLWPQTYRDGDGVAWRPT